MGMGYLIISISDTYIFIILGLITGGAGVGLVMPNSVLWLIALSPVSIRGRIMGNLTTAMFLGQFASPIILQPFISMLSLNKTFALSGLLMLVLAFVFISREIILKNKLKLEKAL